MLSGTHDTGTLSNRRADDLTMEPVQLRVERHDQEPDLAVIRHGTHILCDRPGPTCVSRGITVKRSCRRCCAELRISGA